jgi:tellurite resistance-related uncharacterized protein
MELVAYKRTPTFTEDTVPAGLLRDHATKAGVYGRIVVEAGTLTLTMDGQTQTLEAGDVAVAPPERRHSVAPVGSVRFHVEFCRPAEG